MLRPVEGEALLTIWEGNHVEKYDTLATEFRRHPTRSVVADGARKQCRAAGSAHGFDRQELSRRHPQRAR